MNTVHEFVVPKATLRRCFSIYVVVAKKENEIIMYVGKTGDNRDGCNPIISRCGNHFSYNPIHSQVRNKLPNHEEFDYKYFFVHFDNYDKKNRKIGIELINEMERYVINRLNDIYNNDSIVKVLNSKILGKYVKKEVKEKRMLLRTKENLSIVDTLLKKAIESIRIKKRSKNKIICNPGDIVKDSAHSRAQEKSAMKVLKEKSAAENKNYGSVQIYSR